MEPAYGEKREETLRIAGIKTYYIKKILKPVRATLWSAKNYYFLFCEIIQIIIWYLVGHFISFFLSQKFVETNDAPKEDNGSAVTIEADGPSEDFKDEVSKVRWLHNIYVRIIVWNSAFLIFKCETPKDETVLAKTSKEEDFKNRLRKELVSRDGHGWVKQEIILAYFFGQNSSTPIFVCSELSKDTTIFLHFTNKELESSYEQHREPLSSVPLVAFFLIHLIGALYSSLILPRSVIQHSVCPFEMNTKKNASDDNNIAVWKVK